MARPNAIFFSFCACWLFGTFFPVIQTQRPNHFFPLGNFHSEHEQGYDSRYGLFSAACIDKFVCPGRGRFHWLPSSGRHHGRILRLSYTVSIWVLELSDLRRRHAYTYGVFSVVVGLCMLVLEIGSLKGTRGCVTPICFQRLLLTSVYMIVKIIY